MGLVAATTVGGVNFAGVSYKNIASAQTPEGNEPNKPEEQNPRSLTEKEAMEVIAKGLGNYSSWAEWCAANNIAYDVPFFDADAKKLTLLQQHRQIEFDNEVNALYHKKLKKRRKESQLNWVQTLKKTKSCFPS